MKLKMLETYQAVDQPSPLVEGQEYEVSETLGAWLLEHRKAEKAGKAARHYGAQKEPELRADDVIYKEVQADNAVKVVEELPEEEIMSTKSKPKRKGSK